MQAKDRRKCDNTKESFRQRRQAPSNLTYDACARLAEARASTGFLGLDLLGREKHIDLRDDPAEKAAVESLSKSIARIEPLALVVISAHVLILHVHHSEA